MNSLGDSFNINYWLYKTLVCANNNANNVLHAANMSDNVNSCQPDSLMTSNCLCYIKVVPALVP